MSPLAIRGGRPPGSTVIPTAEDALDFLIDRMREGHQATAAYGYDLWISKVTDHYAQLEVSREGAPHGGRFEWQPVSQEVSPPFMDAAWQLCRLGVLRPGVREITLQSVREGEGFAITEFGRTWLAEHSSPAYVPTDPGRMASLLTRRQDLFGEVYVLRASDAARCYSAHAYYACCAMIGAAAESILVAAGVAKIGEDAAMKKYLATNGRKSLTEAVLKGCPDYVAREFRLHTDLIALWRDQSAHAHSNAIGETEAFTNFRGLIKFAQFAEQRWQHLTGSEP
jgi:hypothetical protein